MRFEPKGAFGVPTITLSRRNLLTLLAKLDGYPPESKCSIAREGIVVKAEEDHIHYAKRPAGQMHPLTEDQIPKPPTGIEWA